MSYRDGIIDWLTECTKIAINQLRVRKTINQYIQLIEQLTGTTMDENHMNEVADIAFKNIDSTLALLEAQDKIKQTLRDNVFFSL